MLGAWLGAVRGETTYLQIKFLHKSTTLSLAGTLNYLLVSPGLGNFLVIIRRVSTPWEMACDFLGQTIYEGEATCHRLSHHGDFVCTKMAGCMPFPWPPLSHVSMLTSIRNMKVQLKFAQTRETELGGQQLVRDYHSPLTTAPVSQTRA